jgi:hypothetical protein
MRAIILAALVAAGIGLVGASNVSAAPANGAAIGAPDSNVTTVQHWRWGSRHHRRWARCHYRYRSGWYRC